MLGAGTAEIQVQLKIEVRSQNSDISYNSVQNQATLILSGANWQQNISRFHIM